MDNQFLSIEPKKDTTITTKRQIERGAISKAIYMVTDLFEEGEPLKSALRNTAVEILKDNDIRQTTNLKSMLILSREIGLVSELNVQILLRAIEGVEVGSKASGNIVDISGVLKATPEHSGAKVIEDTIYSATPPPVEISKTEAQVISTEPIKKPERPTPTVSMSTTLDIGTRRKKILEVVRSKGQATIHEFTQSIQGCSSKTIQRELTSLVLSGTLKKTGERRWSKYSLR